MTDIVEKLRLREMAEENRFFAHYDIELIDALHRRQLASLKDCHEPSEQELAKVFEDRYRALAETHDQADHETKGHDLLHGLRELLDEIKQVCRRGDRA